MSDPIQVIARRPRREGNRGTNRSSGGQARTTRTATSAPSRSRGPSIAVAILIGAIMVAPVVALEVSRIVGPDGEPGSGLALVAVLWALLTLAVFLLWSLARRLGGEDDS